MSKDFDPDALVDEATEKGQLRREVQERREEVKALEEALGKIRKALDLAEAVDAADPSPPKWTRKKGKGKHPAIPVFLFTDSHFDEVVSPEEVLGLNAYNRQIAYGRTERAFRGAVRVAKDYVASHSYDGCVLLLGGDVFSGDIHDELKETNETTVVDSLVYWLEPVLAGVHLLTEEFGKVHIAGVVGNHGRRTRKPRAKRRVQDNMDWLFYRLLGRELAGDDRVTMQISDSPDLILPVYDLRVLLTHGDQFRGGSGISAALSPLLLGEHRKTKRHAAAARHGGEEFDFDLMVMGHFHNRIILPRVMVGGSLKGYDEYAFSKNIEYQPPSQELFIVAPERGPIANFPVWVEDREAEGW